VCSAALVFAACEDDPASMLDATVDAGDYDADGHEHDADGHEHDAGEHDAGEHDAGGEPDADAGGSPIQLELSFEGRVGSAEFDCTQTYAELGTSKVSARLKDFRFYVYDVRLLNEAGEEVSLELTQDEMFQYQNVALLDFEDATGSCSNGTTATNKVIKGTLPAGTYKGIRFGVGVPFALNHGNFDLQPPPLNLSALAWPWTLGHVFVRIDATVVVSAGPTPSFVIHLGSDMCSGNPAAGEEVSCVHPNRAAIELSDFDPESQKIVFDYAALVAKVALDDDQGGEVGCMAGAADPECDSIFGQLGIDPETGVPAGAAQSVFSAVPK
jgi:uncharacterized repeat protein (TIGR04052 family)